MIKCTALFNSVSNSSASGGASTRTGGWSESIYNIQEPAAARNEFLDYCSLRAAILPKGFAIVGQRFQIVDGPSSTLGRRFPAPNAFASDCPQIGLQLKAQAGGTVNVRRWTFRGIPDEMVVEGEYQPTDWYRGAVLNAAGFITGGNWRFSAKVLTWPILDLVGITDAGLLTTVLEHGFVPGNAVELLRCKDAYGRSVRGDFIVTDPVVGNSATLANYKKPAVVSGQVRRLTYGFLTIDGTTLEVQRVVVKKVGRPFGGYSGRRSRRR